MTKKNPWLQVFLVLFLSVVTLGHQFRLLMTSFLNNSRCWGISAKADCTRQSSNSASAPASLSWTDMTTDWRRRKVSSDKKDGHTIDDDESVSSLWPDDVVALLDQVCLYARRLKGRFHSEIGCANRKYCLKSDRKHTWWVKCPTPKHTSPPHWCERRLCPGASGLSAEQGAPAGSRLMPRCLRRQRSESLWVNRKDFGSVGRSENGTK